MFLLLTFITFGFIQAWHFKASIYANDRETLNSGTRHESVHDQVKLTFGDFNSFNEHYPDMNLTDYIFFACAVVLITLIIFNLLVAIFTDTYDEIKQNEKAIELKMMNEVVMDTESYVKWFTPTVIFKP